MKTRYQVALLRIAVLLLLGGCAGTPGPQQVSAADDGARIWRMNCARCHNLRPVPEFTAPQWTIIVAHMRTHSDLTKSESDAVAVYLRDLTNR